MQLTQRQLREREYHKDHAHKSAAILTHPFNWDILKNPGSRWWNAYWRMYAYLSTCNLKGKRVLVVGCGFGDDALRLAGLGAEVFAFDLSPDSLSVARRLAAREGVNVAFDEMPSERLSYADSTFDMVLARDILHHVDIEVTMREIVRVSKPGAVFVANEIYSHSITDKIRRSSFVDGFLYPRMRRLIYGTDKPYITEDERKLSEDDLRLIEGPLGPKIMDEHFYFLCTRIFPERMAALAKMDRVILSLLRPLGRLLAGRVLFSAPIIK